MRVAAWLLLTLLAGVPLAAQQGDAASHAELQRLQVAVTLERTGDLAGAERALLEVLEANPTSLSGLLSLERVLRLAGRPADLLPAIDRLLARDPASAIGHQMRLRTHSALDRPDDIERSGAAWIRAAPGIATPYREIARVWSARGEHRRAAAALEQGRARIRRGEALALELGDIHAELGDWRRAAREWDLAIGEEGRGLLLVRRRLAALPDGGATIAPRIVDALLAPPASVIRRRAAVELAIAVGLEARAHAAAAALLADLPETQRQSFLIETARQADGARLHHLAHWAYSAMGQVSAAGRALAIRKRVAELSLILGDTAAASVAFQEIERAYSPGSSERREAAAIRVQLAARGGEPDAAARDLAEFRQTFPDAPELDATAAIVAAAVLARDPAAAERLLIGVRGPRSSIVRGRAALYRGDMAAARTAFLAAAPALSGAEQTELIALAALLGRLSPAGGALAAEALGLVDAQRQRDAVALLDEESVSLPGDERAALIDFAAGLADRIGARDESEALRRTIVTDYATSIQAPAALLALARAFAANEPRSDEAAELLERLILEHPRSALVPQARRELERVRGRVPST
jgi:tetratricopeptide (TPR) repeat protein